MANWNPMTTDFLSSRNVYSVDDEDVGSALMGYSKRMDGWMDGWITGLMDGFMDGWMDHWMDGWMNGWVNGWVIGWMD